MSSDATRLDLRGLKCPLPVLHTRRALARLRPGDLLLVDTTDPLAIVDIPHLAGELGAEVEQILENGWGHQFLIRAG
ncbi:MAG TPA: sulfurtransferase TusA family protein [Methylovirgula sp.]|nr:sulfurtransferase TusA family protein [Methylovirgula sp.]